MGVGIIVYSCNTQYSTELSSGNLPFVLQTVAIAGILSV